MYTPNLSMLTGNKATLPGVPMCPQVVLLQRDISTGVLSLAEAIQLDSATFAGLSISGTVAALALSGSTLFVSVTGSESGLVVLNVSCTTPTPTEGICAMRFDALVVPEAALADVAASLSVSSCGCRSRLDLVVAARRTVQMRIRHAL